MRVRWTGPSVAIGPPLGLTPEHGAEYDWDDDVCQSLLDQGKVEKVEEKPAPAFSFLKPGDEGKE